MGLKYVIECGCGAKTPELTADYRAEAALLGWRRVGTARHGRDYCPRCWWVRNLFFPDQTPHAASDGAAEVEDRYGRLPSSPVLAVVERTRRRKPHLTLQQLLEDIGITERTFCRIKATGLVTIDTADKVATRLLGGGGLYELYPHLQEAV